MYLEKKVTEVKSIEVTHIHITIPVRTSIPEDFPMINCDEVAMNINLETGQIEEWGELHPDKSPKAFDLYVKVSDSGVYQLYNELNDIVVDEIDGGYVPIHLLPGEDNDYIDFKINKDGVITNWRRGPNLYDFERERE